MSLKTVRYFSTIIAAAIAVSAGWWVWSYYMQPSWACDGKVRTEQVSTTPQVSGNISELHIKDNQSVNKGDALFIIDRTSFHIAELNAQVQLAKAQSDLMEANNKANCRRCLSQNHIPAEDLDTVNLNVKAMQASVEVAEASLRQTQWRLTQAVVKAPVTGWVTNLFTRTGDYTSTGKPLLALVDSHSSYVMGYFEETKLHHIHEGAPALIMLYSGDIKLQGYVSNIGRATYDQSMESDSGLIPDIKPNVPWAHPAQRVPVCIEFDALPWEVTLVSGTTCSVPIGQRK